MGVVSTFDIDAGIAAATTEALLVVVNRVTHTARTSERLYLALTATGNDGIPADRGRFHAKLTRDTYGDYHSSPATDLKAHLAAGPTCATTVLVRGA